MKVINNLSEEVTIQIKQFVEVMNVAMVECTDQKNVNTCVDEFSLNCPISAFMEICSRYAFSYEHEDYDTQAHILVNRDNQDVICKHFGLNAFSNYGYSKDDINMLWSLPLFTENEDLYGYNKVDLRHTSKRNNRTIEFFSNDEQEYNSLKDKYINFDNSIIGMATANEMKLNMIDENGNSCIEYRYVGVAEIKNSTQQFYESIYGGMTDFDRYLDSDEHRADIEAEKWGWLKNEC